MKKPTISEIEAMIARGENPIITPSGEVLPRWRPEVVAFADAMEAQLKANDHKPGWKNDDPHALLKRLVEETAELKAVLPNRIEPCSHRGLSECNHLFPNGGWSDHDHNAVLKEAADAANFAMMIADVCGGLAVKVEASK